MPINAAPDTITHELSLTRLMLLARATLYRYRTPLESAKLRDAWQVPNACLRSIS
jgi:hypothetical protein